MEGSQDTWTSETEELPVAAREDASRSARSYLDAGPIASGAMGEVRRVIDPVFERPLAMKLLRPELVRTRAAARLRREARVTARLEHPGIVPVHDLGCRPDGRPWFTMKEVRGATLGATLAAHHRAPDPAGLRRLVALFHRVCETVAFVHAQGYVHRDIKPENVMVGDYGEVLLMDFGLARAVGSGDPDEDGPEELTHRGAVIGTPTYMPPEQARGEPVDRTADVYALGAVLYEVLAGRPPFEGPALVVLEAVVRGRRPAPPPGPEELAQLALRAMSPSPKDRPGDGAAMAEAVASWLHGAQRRERALALVARADPLAAGVAALRARVAALRDEAAARLAPLPAHAPIAQKAPAWALEEEAEALERRADEREGEQVQLLRSALTEVPDLPEAHERLADHFRERWEEAARVRDLRGQARLEALVRQHDRGRHAAWLAGDGAVTVVTDPPGARVRLYGYVSESRRLVARDAGVLGYTPLRAVPLPMGSYVLVIEAPGHVPVRYPVAVGRCEHVDGRPPPGARTDGVLRLPRLGEVGPDERYVPPGWFGAGGDPEAVGATGPRRLWVDGFVIRRFPVTLGEYARWLDHLVETGGPALAHEHEPRRPDGSVVARGPDGRYAPTVDVEGDQWIAEMPAVLITRPEAEACAAWMARRDGLPWRLPSEWEWEKAARGVDRRAFPWGEAFDPSFCYSRYSFDRAPSVLPADAFPADESPYGVRGMAGYHQEWCAGSWDFAQPAPPDGAVVDPRPAGGPVQALSRGGALTGEVRDHRAASRHTCHEGRRAPIGFRPVRSWPPDGRDP